MTDPNPALIDTIARAMWEADNEPGSWDRRLDYAQRSQVGLEEVEAWRDCARAALAAMPQPIGYGVVVNEGDFKHVILAPSEQAASAWAYAANQLTSTPVALVPVGGTPATSSPTCKPSSTPRRNRSCD